MGETLERLGRDAEAAAAYRQAIVHQETACARDRSSKQFAKYLEDHRSHLAQVQNRLAAGNRVGSPP
jgi:hypothetical protein